jgi:two-component system phosphate regulon sensor histidine kinase PhoR
MKKKSISVIIGLMTIALLGVMAMQYYFIRQSYLQQAQLFDESVNAAMSSVASKAEKKEVLEFSRLVQQRNQKRIERTQTLERQVKIQEELENLRKLLLAKQQAFKEQEEELFMHYPHAVLLDNSFYETYINNPSNNHLVSIGVGTKRLVGQGNVIQDNFIEVSASRSLPLVPAKDDSVRYLLLMDFNPMTNQSVNNIVTLPPRTDVSLEDEIAQLEKELKLFQAESLTDSIAILGGKNPQLVEDFAISVELSKRPLRQRIDFEYIQDEMQAELEVRDIRTPFQLVLHAEDEVLFSFASNGEEEILDKNASYTTPLFRGDLDHSMGYMTVYFPNKQRELLSNVSVMLGTSIALLLVLVSAFSYTILTILRQKKISEMKTDFINNMTHEFKTPVATIMIASETLLDPDVTNDQKRVSKLAGVIYDENVRLGNHIERVLNIARLEKEEVKLAQEEVELNPMVQGVLDSMELQFQKYGATLEVDLKAEQDTVIGDDLHLSNVVYNLLDNALKYSKENPHIKVATRNVGNQIAITVEDNGIGMSRDQVAKIFDQFYRVPTGNLHNVKGFGLGLSYVSDIVKRMKGKVTAKSEKGKGTIFEVLLPLRSAGN